MEILENSCGARLHASFIIPGGLLKKVPKENIFLLLQNVSRFYYSFLEIVKLLMESRI